MPIVEQTEEQAAAEAGFRAVVDAQGDDLELLRRWWPDRTSPEAAAAVARLLRRAAPDGEVDEAMGAVHAAHGGHDRVPQAVRDRLEDYIRERLGVRPWPERDLPDDPAPIRRRRRGR